MSTDKRKQSLYFPEMMLKEIQREADRLAGHLVVGLVGDGVWGQRRRSGARRLGDGRHGVGDGTDRAEHDCE